MSSELEKGIIKVIPLGKRKEFTEEEKKRIEEVTKEMFRFFGVEIDETSCNTQEKDNVTYVDAESEK